MGIFSGFMEWYDKKSDKAKQSHYTRGYDYAAGVLLRGEKKPQEVMNEYTTGSTFSESPHLVSFDHGMEDATDRVCESGAVEDDRINMNYYR